ncbi:hypothetical protein L1987_86152 [Smallanthus sonchifolius]|uniref:Uncharacterized protein n=1 Tax=Smallanthus sonchifolius TaxID=185202 RepID=A0ACB8XZ62_9ASTR|nr:hypothetical protein L1987_86152 [Smallanthus sonchifolius]
MRLKKSSDQKDKKAVNRYANTEDDPIEVESEVKTMEKQVKNKMEKQGKKKKRCLGKVLIKIESSSKNKGVRLRKKDFILISESKSRDLEKIKKSKKVRVGDIKEILQQSSSLELTKRKNKVKSESTKVKWLTLQTRSSPNQLLDGIPSKLAHYVVDKFKARKMEIRTPSGDIKVDTDSIHSLLGVPKGGIKMYSITPLEVLDDKVKEWRDQYEGRFMAPSEIVRHIESSRDEDIETDFRNIDWCDYIIENLKVCKIGWNRFDNSSPFNGPLTVLTILYVDSVECRKMKVDYTINQITFWTMDRMRIRKRLEIKGKGFSKGRFKGLTISVNNQTIGEREDISLEFQEEYISVLKKLDDFEEKKKEIENDLSEIYKKNIERSKVILILITNEFEDTGVNDNEMEDNNIDILVELEVDDNIDVNQVFQNEATEIRVNDNEMENKNIDISVDLEADDNVDVN